MGPFSSLKIEPFSGTFFRKRSLQLAAFCMLSGLLLKSRFVTDKILLFAESVFSIQLNREFREAGFSMTGSCLMLIGFIMILYRLSLKSLNIHSERRFFLFAALLIPAFYWFTLHRQAVNVPITDDYYTILNFLNSFILLPDLHQQWNMIWQPYVETRIVMTKLLAVGMWKITGVISFTWFIYLINVAVTIIGCLLVSSVQLKKNGFLVLSVFFVLFQFSYYDAGLWTTAGIHIVLTMLFSFSACYFLQKSSVYFFLLALTAALLASFTYGNGLLVFPVGMLMLVTNRARWQLIVWIFCFLALLFIYFDQYVPVRSLHVLTDTNPLALLVYCLAFWGSAVQFMYRLELPVAAGSLFLLIFLWLTKKKYYMVNAFNYCLMLYVVLSALVAGFFRLSHNEVQQALANRYVIYSCTGITAMLIAIAEMNQERFRKKLTGWILFSSVMYFLLSAFFFYPETEIRKNKLNAFITAVKSNQKVEFAPPVIPSGADTIIHLAMKNGFYRP